MEPYYKLCQKCFGKSPYQHYQLVFISALAEHHFCWECNQQSNVCLYKPKLDLEAPISNRTEFIAKYKNNASWKVFIEEFIRKCPDFPDGESMAQEIGIVVADLKPL